MNNNLEVAHPQSGSSSGLIPSRIGICNSWSFWFLRRGENREYPEKNLSEQRRESTTNSTHIWRQRRELNPGHIGGRRVQSPMRFPRSPTNNRLCVLTVSHNFIEFFLLCSPTEANKPSSHKCSQPHHHTDMDKTCADQSGHTS